MSIAICNGFQFYCTRSEQKKMWIWIRMKCECERCRFESMFLLTSPKSIFEKLFSPLLNGSIFSGEFNLRTQYPGHLISFFAGYEAKQNKEKYKINWNKSFCRTVACKNAVFKSFHNWFTFLNLYLRVCCYFILWAKKKKINKKVKRKTTVKNAFTLFIFRFNKGLFFIVYVSFQSIPWNFVIKFHLFEKERERKISRIWPVLQI